MAETLTVDDPHTADVFEPLPIEHMPDLFSVLARAMEQEAEAVAAYKQLEAKIKEQLRPFREAAETQNQIVIEFRAALERNLRHYGIKTMDGAGLEAIATSTTRLEVIDLDRALAHLSDLERLNEVTEVTYRTAGILSIARELEKTPAPLEGVERVSTPAFTIRKQKGH